jgi:hypothetical protein
MLRYILLCFNIILGFGHSVYAQLGGDYTIGGSTGSNNFKNWSEFATDWNKNGLRSTVRISVLSDDSISVPVVLRQHPNHPTTANQKLIINGNGKRLAARLSKEVLHLNGIDHVVIKGLVVENTSEDAGLIGIRFSNAADSNIIDSCQVYFSKLKSVSGARDSGAYIAFCQDSGSITKEQTTHRGVGNLIKRCKLYSQYKESSGPFFGILDQQGSVDYVTKYTQNRFDSNEISTFYSVGILMRYVNGEKCRGNRITRERCDENSETDTLMLGIFCLDGNSDSEPLIIDANTIVHLPYKDADVTQSSDYILNLFGINLWNIIGGKNLAHVTNNELIDLMYHKSFYGIFSQFGEQVRISKNRLYDIRGNIGYSYGIYSQYGDDVHLDSNRLRKIDFGSKNGGDGVMIFGYEMQSGTWGLNTIRGNVIDSNSAYTELFLIPVMMVGNWDISGNILVHNKCVYASMFSLGRTVGIYEYFCGNVQIYNNIVAQNFGEAETYYIFTQNYSSNQSLSVRHNTLFDSFQTNSYHISSMMYLDDDSRTDVVGNIVQGIGNGEVFAMFLNTIGTLGDVKYNSIHFRGYQNETWAFENFQYSDFNDWRNNGAKDTHTFWVTPNFANLSTRDYRSVRTQNQNNVPTHSQINQDIWGISRHPQFCDRGAVVDTFNISLRYSQKFSDTVCSGADILEGVYVKNQYADTVKRVTLVIQKDKNTYQEIHGVHLAPGDTHWIALNQVIRLNQWGQNELKVIIGTSNDWNADDSVNQKLWVTVSPGGSVFTPNIDSSQKNVPILGSQQDVLLLNKEIAYQVSAPRGYTDVDYGTKWSADMRVVSKSGTPVTGARIVPPTSQKSLIVSFKTDDPVWEDSFLRVFLKISDLQNRCDTIYQRQLFIEPTAHVDYFSDSVICLGDSIYFTNKTTFNGGSSYLEYHWDFGNKESDILYEPGVLYKDTGWYTVRLKVTSKPYGYEFVREKRIRVNAGPTISFTREVACEGRQFNFINTAYHDSVVYRWNFGDGTIRNSSADTLSYTYSKRGNYDVQLLGVQYGCSTISTQRVNVFEQPVLKYDAFNVVCSHRSIKFQDLTNMQTSIYGVRWEFEDSTFNTQKTAYHTFTKNGSNKVKFIVRSEFGCSDSATFQVFVNPSPKADFTHNTFCINRNTEFKNMTTQVPLTLRQSSWTLNDQVQVNGDSWSQSWKDTGLQKVGLIVALDNGCSDTLVKTVNVLKSVDLDFYFDTLCAGDSVSITNTSPNRSDLKYHWYWLQDSFQGYSVKVLFDVVTLTTVPIRLQVTGEGYCTEERIKDLLVLPRPQTCNFEFETDYASSFYGVKFNPKNDQGVLGGQDGVTYTWDIEGLGKGNTQGLDAVYKIDLNNNGTYNVMMTAITDAHRCRCMFQKPVTLDRLEQSMSSAASKLNLYPNPVVTEKVYLETSDRIHAIELVGVDGKVWEAMFAPSVNSKIEVVLPKVASGMYELRCYGERQMETVKILVSSFR